MSFQDVAFLPSRASFSTTFLKKIVVWVKASGPPRLKNIVEGYQGHAPCKTLLLHKVSLVSVEFHEDHKIACKDEVKSDHPQFSGYYQISNSGLSV